MGFAPGVPPASPTPTPPPPAEPAGAREPGPEPWGNPNAAMRSLTSKIREELQHVFNPEFLNRLDDTIIFHPLEKAHIAQIVSILLRDVAKRLSEEELSLRMSDAAIDFLVKHGFDQSYGARPLKRAIQSELENPLAKAILEGRFAPKDQIRVDYRGGRMVFEKAPAKAAA